MPLKQFSKGLLRGVTGIVLFGLSVGHVLALAGGPTLVAQTSPTSVAVGEQFTANIILDTKTYSVSAVELHLTFPADKLQALSIVAGTFLPTVLTTGTTGNGTATITVASGTAAKQGVGTIAVVTFRALAPGTAQIGFDSTTQVAATGQSSNVVDTMTPATETITGTGTVTPLPTTTPTPSTIGQAATVSTGPGETILLAVVVSCIAALLYVGYLGTNVFRQREIEAIAQEERNHPADFRDPTPQP